VQTDVANNQQEDNSPDDHAHALAENKIGQQRASILSNDGKLYRGPRKHVCLQFSERTGAPGFLNNTAKGVLR
jgi:hypothetical protein